MQQIWTLMHSVSSAKTQPATQLAHLRLCLVFEVLEHFLLTSLPPRQDRRCLVEQMNRLPLLSAQYVRSVTGSLLSCLARARPLERALSSVAPYSAC